MRDAAGILGLGPGDLEGGRVLDANGLTLGEVTHCDVEGGRVTGCDVHLDRGVREAFGVRAKSLRISLADVTRVDAGVVRVRRSAREVLRALAEHGHPQA